MQESRKCKSLNEPPRLGIRQSSTKSLGQALGACPIVWPSPGGIGPDRLKTCRGECVRRVRLLQKQIEFAPWGERPVAEYRLGRLRSLCIRRG